MDDPADDPESDEGDPETPDADASQAEDAEDAAEDEPGDPADDEDVDDDAFDQQFETEFAEGQECSTSTLKRRALVHEATVDRSGSGRVVVAIRLVRR